MYYAIGTQITFTEKKESAQEKPELYIPGTRLVFLDWFPSLRVQTIAPA